MSRRKLLKLLEKYRTDFPQEKLVCDAFNTFIEAHGNCFDRGLLIGHITGSAWTIDQEKKCALFTHHRKLDAWMQLGGHADGDPDIFAVALKEAKEESGLMEISALSSDIFDLDIHLIPEHKGVPEHQHFDVRFLFSADSTAPLIVSNESKELAWLPFEDILRFSQEPSILRMLSKTMVFLI